MKKVAEISNQNLLRNFDAYISSGGKIDPDNQFSWIDDLNASDLISLCYVWKYFRKLVLKFFLKVYDFCSVNNYTNVIQKNLFNLFQHIHNDTFFNETFYTYNFDFKENYENLLKIFCHMSLFQFACIF